MDRRWLIVAAAIAASVAAALPGALGATVTTPVSCGQLITRSIVVGNDLTDCPGTALSAGANGITINLNGHTIDGNNTGTGDGVEVDGFNGVTVENGVVQQFDFGIAVIFGSGNKVINVTATANAVDGFDIQSPRSIVQRSYAIQNTNGFVAASDNTTFSNDAASEPSSNGFLTSGSFDAVDSSTVFFASGMGIEASAGTGVKITNNHILASTGDGILLGGSGGTIAGNEIANAGATAINVTGSASTITKNAIGVCTIGISVNSAANTTISENVVGQTGSGDGISVAGGTGVKITSNSVTEIAGDGISSAASGALVTGNLVGHATGNGIVVQSTDPANVSTNTVEVAHTDGIDVTSSSPSTVSGNKVVQAVNGEGILVTASGTKVTKNTVETANLNGIHIAATANGDTIQGNTVETAITDDGLLVEGSDHSILQNVARGNVNVGIHDTSTGSKVAQNIAIANDVGIVTAGTDGGGNKAAGNRLAQCGGVVCAAP